MNRFSERGSVIRETGPVYYTKNMDKIVKWFEDTLVGIVKLMSEM